MMTFAYEVWDVFTDVPLTGNQLAVFPDARGLADDQMLSIAREMNFSETTFVFPREPEVQRRKGVRTRIFLKTAEIPFAGHPVLGTAFALWTADRTVTDVEGLSVTLDINAGPIRVTFAQVEGGHWHGTMTQPEPEFREIHQAPVIGPLLGVELSAIDGSIPIQTVSTGRPNVLVMLKTLAAIQQVRFDWNAMDEYFASGDTERSFYLVCPKTRVESRHFHARKILRNGEDPVTGSAAGCAIAWLVKHGRVTPDTRTVIEQGTEMEREGEAITSASLAGDRVTNVRVGGGSVLVMTGTLRL